MEINSPPCPTHGSIPRALHSENFEGIVTVIENIIETVSGVGTISYSRCPYGYPSNFEGVVRVLEDLNTSISGIQGGGAASSGIVAGSGIYISQSGDFQVINADAVSGLTIQAGSGIYLSDGNTKINLLAEGQGNVTIAYSGNLALISGAAQGGSTGGSSVTVSGEPGTNYSTGSLWFNTNQGRLFVYASGDNISTPDWYQTNAEALVYKSEEPPSGAGYNAPPRDGSLWFNNLVGSLFVYDALSSGWYEAGSTRNAAYGSASPAPTTQGSLWVDSTVNQIKTWDGTAWVSV
jgi:hypothetical protein